jgi:cob(I)alamin adenosyltransferase
MMNENGKIYTRTGDQGMTGLWDGTRIAKDSLLMEVFGTLDELSATLTLVLTTSLHAETEPILSEIQQTLGQIFIEFGGQSPQISEFSREAVQVAEQKIDELNQRLSPVNHFIQPARNQAAAFLNLARAICRRAERRLWDWRRQTEFNPQILVYFNRLSDLLFTLMRWESETPVDSGRAQH